MMFFFQVALVALTATWRCSVTDASAIETNEGNIRASSTTTTTNAVVSAIRNDPFNVDGGNKVHRRLQETITEDEVRDLFNLWNDALATLDSEKVAARYSKDAVLLATVSDTPRNSHELIVDYFDAFLLKKPQGVIIEGVITTGNDWAQDAGIYEFTFGSDGTMVKARYSYVYVWEDGEWKIAHHHSSVLPEATTISFPITESEVRGLFSLWNDALATLDSDVVTARYSAGAVLLPTVSDTPRTSPELIKDYFDKFLLNEPQGVILESYVHIGTNWAKDSGIYIFTFKDGSTVRARYTYVYVIENGKWVIEHHHSSMMPESMPTPIEPITEEEVRALLTAWSDAVAAGDVDAVMATYANNAVVVPTSAQKVLNTASMIQDYIEEVIKMAPAVSVLSGDIIIGNNAAEDSGILEVTTDGTVSSQRYTMAYSFENGAWKISLQHLSLTTPGLLC